MRATTSTVLSLILLVALTAFPTFPAQADEDGKEEKKPWSGSVALSGGHSSGTINSFTGRLQAGVQRDWERDRVRLNLDAMYGKSDGDIDTNYQRLFGDYRHNFTHRFFGYWNAEVGRDTVEAVKLRASTTLGPGYRIWEQDEKSFLDGEIGFGYLHESFLDGTPSRDSPQIRAAYDYEDVLGPEQVLEISHGTEILMPLPDVEDFLVRSDLALAVPLIMDLKFRLSFGVEYQNEPAHTAEKWSTKSTFGLLYEF